MDISSSSKSNSTDSSNLKMYFAGILIITVVITFFVGFLLGKNIGPSDSSTEMVLSSKTNQVTSAPTSTPTPTPYVISTVQGGVTPAATQPDNKACSKYGFGQKWEYLTSYVVKEGDSLPSIARDQLKDETRINELIKINGAGPYIVASTLYLPPASITKSSGNLKLIYGKLWEKNSSSWHLLLSTDPKGQGILAPAYLFEKVPNKESFKLGDCLRIFLDDGYEVYSVSQQS